MTHKHTAIYMKTILKKNYTRFYYIQKTHNKTKENKKNNNKTGLRKQKGNSIIFNKKKTTIFYDTNFGEFWNRTGKESFWLFE